MVDNPSLLMHGRYAEIHVENIIYLPSRRVHVHLPKPVESFPFDDICAFAVAFIVKVDIAMEYLNYGVYCGLISAGTLG